MLSLTNKRILLGITGGIAAYKSAEIVRTLQKNGAQVRVVMTKGAQAFITPLTLQALSGHPVLTEVLSAESEAAMNHIELARWADCILVAPATANFIAMLTGGMASDLLTTLCLARTGRLAIAPAMNQAMWLNEATQHNMKLLAGRDIAVFGPAQGEQACGDVGPGRMLEPVDIVQEVANLFGSPLLAGKKVVITAGPTRELIDPVRYLTNYSSGKMGYALAQAAAEAGAQVVLISGPVQLGVPAGVRYVAVETALQMHAAAMTELTQADIFIGAAAVADFRPKKMDKQKIKKGIDDSLTLTLIKNPDIIADVASHPSAPFTVGFAAETERLAEHALAKLRHKRLDMVIANDVSQEGIGFNGDCNAVTVFYGESEQRYSVTTKAKLARELVALVAAQYMKSVT